MRSSAGAGGALFQRAEEAMWLFNGWIYEATAVSAALAANLSLVALVNPSGSGVNLALIQAISVFAANQVLEARYLNAVQAGTDHAPVPVMPGGAAAAGTVRDTQVAAAPGTVARQFISSTTSTYGVTNSVMAVLPPGSSFMIMPQAVNIQLTAYFRWAELPR